MVSAKLSRRLSLNNPPNISHSSKKICYKNDRVKERERERDDKNKENKKIWKKKERKRTSEFDAK